MRVVYEVIMEKVVAGGLIENMNCYCLYREDADSMAKRYVGKAYVKTHVVRE